MCALVVFCICCVATRSASFLLIMMHRRRAADVYQLFTAVILRAAMRSRKIQSAVNVPKAHNRDVAE